MIHFGQSIPPFIQTTNNHTNYCLSRKTISLQLQWRQNIFSCYLYEYADSQNYFFFYHQFSSTNKNRNIFTIFRLISTSALLKTKTIKDVWPWIFIFICIYSYFVHVCINSQFIRIFLKYSNSLSLYYSHVSKINCIFIYISLLLVLYFFALTIHFYYIYF